MFERLTSPIRINSLELRNRMVIPAMHLAMLSDGKCTDEFLEYYKRRAEGGVGLIIAGSCRFDQYGSDFRSMSLASDDTVESWKRFTDELHKAGCKCAVQLYHAGRYVRKADVICKKEALSPSETYCTFTRETAPAMSIAQIEELIEDYAAGTRRAVKAGFDAVEISGSSGYLLCQFLSPLTNKRTDIYGGSAENRMRLPLAVIRRVREEAGESYPIIYRLGADDLVEGSNKLEDILPFVRPAAEAGVDCFNVTGGWHESKVPQLTGEVPEAGLYFMARAVRKEAGVPVIINNRVSTPFAAEKAIALGDADMAGIGRECVADPDFPKKAAAGTPELIRPCVACNQGCLGNVFFGKPLRCHVNAQAGHEIEAGPQITKKSRKVLVAGGGPAGCEAALRCAEAGHEVVLMEADRKIGGLLKLVERLPGRQEYKKLINYYTESLYRAGVKVILGKAMRPEDAEGFDEVILARGGREKRIKLNAEAGAEVVSARDVIAGKVIAGQRCVVIGASFIGCETARYLADDAAMNADELFYLSVYKVRPPEMTEKMLGQCRREVILIDKKRKAGYGFEPGTGWPVLQELGRLGVKILTETEVTAVTKEGVSIRQKDGTESFISCDTAVAVHGSEPDKEFEAVLKAKGIKVRSIGNEAVTGKSIDAVRQGYEAALSIK